ncbi:MAG: iron ABC transporter [Deltaproteobacteria bacterium]|nr:MAG: iron ABC transporter [Deltaproteobacteria bacterium]
MSQPVFSLENCCFSYGRQFSLQDVSAEIRPGIFYGIIGPNGSGKTTLLDLLLAHKKISAGRLLFRGKSIYSYTRAELAQEISLVPQEYHFNFDFTVHQIVMMGRHPHLGRFSAPTEKDLQIVEENLKLLGIWDLRNRPASQLSGGEKQRLVTARALCQCCPVLLLDEATASLDIRHTIGIIKTIKEKVKQGVTVIAIMHDLNLAAACCDFLLALKSGRLFALGKSCEVLSPPMIKELFGVSANIINGKIFYEYK